MEVNLETIIQLCGIVHNMAEDIRAYTKTIEEERKHFLARITELETEIASLKRTYSGAPLKPVPEPYPFPKINPQQFRMPMQLDPAYYTPEEVEQLNRTNQIYIPLPPDQRPTKPPCPACEEAKQQTRPQPQPQVKTHGPAPGTPGSNSAHPGRSPQNPVATHTPEVADDGRDVSEQAVDKP